SVETPRVFARLVIRPACLGAIFVATHKVRASRRSGARPASPDLCHDVSVALIQRTQTEDWTFEGPSRRRRCWIIFPDKRRRPRRAAGYRGDARSLVASSCERRNEFL